ncbi:MAG: zinc ABC transporter substrate-binding protein [Acholeplasmataceae bacterium]|nr:zinc ABC transporter substrate-binding protein [Acholeplasmataceae bacterium]
MKKIIITFAILINLIFLTACTQNISADIVTTMFPGYDFARQIVGDKMTVSQIIPPGAEVHEYEATSQDMVSIKEAKLFIYTSLDIDTWINDSSSIGGEDTIVINLSENYTPVDYPYPMDFTLDQIQANTIHFWTDPANTVQLIQVVLEQIIVIDPDNELYYRQNAESYINQINDFSQLIYDFFTSDTYLGSTIYFAGHNALASFAARYGLRIISLFEEFKPDADLTSNELITFMNDVRVANTHYIFIEALEFPKAANTIKEQLSLENYDLTLLKLYAFENVSKTDFEEKVTYLDLMERNFDQLQIALVTT